MDLTPRMQLEGALTFSHLNFSPILFDRRDLGNAVGLQLGLRMLFDKPRRR